jgi:hypothetical protein
VLLFASFIARFFLGGEMETIKAAAQIIALMFSLVLRRADQNDAKTAARDII